MKKIKLLKNNYEYIPSQSDVNHLVVATGAVTISKHLTHGNLFCIVFQSKQQIHRVSLLFERIIALMERGCKRIPENI